jgi:Fuc2NAc and GlcNAc transferase
VTCLLCVAAGALVVSFVVTGLVRRRALSINLMDVPNARSSHSHPTPRGGGVAIVIASQLAFGVLTLFGLVSPAFFFALAGGGTAVAVVGYLDDRGRIGIVARFAVHLAASIWAVAFIGALDEVSWFGRTIHLGLPGLVLSVIGTAWALNLFNFMDGIDGIAASQAIFMGLSVGLTAAAAGLFPGSLAVGVAIAAASLGFLLWNWPPARIFMGDVGSGYLGFVLAIFIIWVSRQDPRLLPVCLVLGSLFIIDATVTLFRRLARRERVYEAHRSHAYQWLSRRWKSHLRVTLAYGLVNVLCLAPAAWLCFRFPEMAWPIVAISWGGLAVLGMVAGTGRAE